MKDSNKKRYLALHFRPCEQCIATGIMCEACKHNENAIRLLQKRVKLLLFGIREIRQSIEAHDKRAGELLHNE